MKKLLILLLLLTCCYSLFAAQFRTELVENTTCNGNENRACNRNQDDLSNKKRDGEEVLFSKCECKSSGNRCTLCTTKGTYIKRDDSDLILSKTR